MFNHNNHDNQAIITTNQYALSTAHVNMEYVIWNTAQYGICNMEYIIWNTDQYRIL